LCLVASSLARVSFGDTLEAKLLDTAIVTVALPMTRLIVAALCLAAFALNGCDNRTRDAKRWDQIAETRKKDKNVQPWSDAESPWAN
jgi:hypothetical protein